MRLHAMIATLTGVVAMASAGSTAFAATVNNTNTTNNNSNPAQNYVTVQNGDYLSGIADKYNTTYVRIFDANSQIIDPNLIYPGEVLRIPAASEQLPNRPLPASQNADTNTNTESVVSAAQATPAAAAAPVDTEQTSPQQSSSSSSQAPAVASGSIWDELAQCESGGNWSIDTGNGFYGGLQFTLSSWQSVGGSGYPNQASRDEQIMRAEMLQSRQGWGAWPVCSAKLGL